MSGTDNRHPHPPCDPGCGCGCHVNDEATYRAVAGVCPACGEQMLGLAVWHRNLDASRVSCMNIRCPDPRAAWKILNDAETDHVVRFGRNGWTLRHPLKERLDDGLMSCPAYEWLATHIPAEADRPGRYRMIEDGPGWRFVALQITEVTD